VSDSRTTGTTDSATGETLLRSPLHAAHAALDASFAPFGGWEMPIKYAEGGVVAEHNAVREAVGLFDVSHLGKALVQGPGAADFVNRCFTADLRRVEPGKAQYTLCCDASGGVLDDLITYLVSPEEVFCVPNAANTSGVVGKLADAAPAEITVTDQHTDFAILAVQGPKSPDVLARLGLPTDMEFMSFTDSSFAGKPVRVCRSGYTGEHGYELLPRSADALALWDELLTAVQAYGGLPCGLGARDTLRTEAGLSLHGHELSPQISPLQASSSWAVGWKKDEFWGREALLAERELGPSRRLRGLLANGRGVPRPGMPVLDENGTALGETTSGTFSPTLKTGIALALLHPDVSFGDAVTLDVRGRSLPCEVVKPPFVESHVR
jgi:aminomethyltransferase